MKFLTTSLALLAVNVCLALSAAVKTTRNGHKRFELDVTWEEKAPDGYSRPQILINGKSPGPPIQVTQGDNVEVIRETRFDTHLRHTNMILSLDSSEQQNARRNYSAFSWHPVSIEISVERNILIRKLGNRVHLGRTVFQVYLKEQSRAGKVSYTTGLQRNTELTGNYAGYGV